VFVGASPRFAVVGAGAIGGYYGAKLASGGCDVRFLLRSDLEVVRRDGFEIREEGKRPLRVPVQAFASTAEIGAVDVVFCAGVLYHHPSPFDLLVALRRICRETLILRTSTIPEVRGLPNAAVYFPMMDARARELWSLKSLGVLHQAGISNEFQASDGYGNWFWGLTPSCLESLLKTAGFRVDHRATEAFAQTVICTAVDAPLDHRLPGEDEAREMAAEISAAGVARPA